VLAIGTPKDTRRTYGHYGKNECEDGEEKIDTKACCEWSDWTEYGECSKDCDGGVRTRTRECMCGDDDDGENNYKRTISGGRHRRNPKCKGHSKEEIPCNEFPCCNWGEFCEWSECDAPCGGVRRRYAKCDCTPQEPVYQKRDDDHGHMSGDGVILDYASEYVECLGDQPYEEEACEPCYPPPDY